MAEPRRGGSPAPPAKSPGPAAPPCAATVNGRRDGNRVVHLGAQLQAWPEELLRQRRGRDGQPEYLVRWSIASLEGRAAGGSGASGAETKPESISVWMSAEEVCASCPALLGERGLEGQGGKGEKAASPLAADAPPEDASLLEMKADVRSLVQRAGRQLAESGAPESSVLNTIHVLSAYAGIGSLAGAFKEAGALDLLMRMLCHKEKRIRRGAGEMLRALAAHDAGSRAYVLLSLSRQDGIEQHMDFDSRYTLLELFAETTSSEEHCMSFEGIHLPQIPGKLLFVLVKRYLCVTSLLDKLSGGVEREDCAEPGLLTEERSHVKQEFEFSMAVANLILELVHVMGWDRSPKPELQPHHDRQPRATHSIFQHRAAPCTAAQAALAPPPKEPSTFKTRSAFPSRSSYVEYVQAKLVRGMRVRMLEDYEQVSAGDEGDFCQSNDGTPPVQVYWQALGCTYWVHWHMVEIIGAPGQEEHEGQEKVSLLTRNHKLAAVAQPFLRQPLGGLYSLPYLGEQPPEAAEALSRAEWWELLFFVKKLEAQEQKELFSLIQQARGEQLSEGDEEALIRLSVPAALAPKVLQVLEERCQGGSRRDLRVSHTYTKYALGRGAGQDGGGSTAASPKGAGCRSAGPGARAAEAAEEAPAAAPAAAAKADAQLFGELLEREGLALPEVPEEQLRGGEAPRAPGDVRALLGGPGDGELAGEAVAALERQLCGGGAGPSGEAARLLQDRGCFGLVLRSLELLGAEKPASLSVLRILSGFLAASRGDALPWHECVEPCLASLSAHSSDREVVREVVGFLHRLASSSKDCAVAMCRLGARETLAKALAKQGTAPPLAPALLALVTDCEEHAGLYQKLTSSVLAGCMQLVLGQIEEHRRSQRPISIPLFDVFLRNLCRGSGVEVKEDKCWEKVQVSSNPHRAGKLTDRNPKTYWESNGSSGSHFITVHMQRGVVVREMSMLVASEDSSYMPARVVVLGGDSPAAVRTELNAVTVLPSDSRVVLLENMTRFWPVLQIRVKRCQQGGIDTRVRGIEVLGPKPTLWPVFKEQLCRRTFLSCTARAHAWCQEICRDRGRLLQLFGKLNRALRHEQAFADRFLPDDEAAWALGRTFWEALVTPLVQSITSPDPQGVSPLAWLLSEYLESAELSGHAASRGAVFGSRVRRLTQLLVHVDPRGAEPEEARAAGGKDGRDEEVPARAAEAAAKSSGLRSIWRCWRDVVQRQVQRFLEAAGQAPDLVERYCGLYRRLRAATEELFGRQAAFVLALGRGFAGALLQLPFLTALHVSERFARYLDGRIRELRGAAGSAEPPQRLQQLLEPFAVLGGLELAHPFEHFYRHYLGDRLLAQGPSWLEGAVAEQLGLCFPSRFPQEMLSDLAESEELRQQFGLFQLQERDRRLLELEAGPGEAPGPASAAAAPEVAPEVKVLALSPRCWPVPPSCSMAEPGRFFSAALSSPLAAFADFCRRRQLRPGRAGAKPRRLQWTWLGRAELRFGDCVLHVSTLQMYILLRFNDAEEVAVEALLQATGLPAALVHQALTPLTRSEGVLARSRTPGAPGVLRLNRAALAQASGRPLRLLPQQRYLRAERAEVGSLERKRNVLCCLITRILKAEKQLHIDNLVFKVVDACQKGELGPRLQFLSFCCHSVDVLSCVLHLLNQGYLRRQEVRPHVLEYVSAEPATPPGGQAQMVFQVRPSEASPDEESTDCLSWLDPGIDTSEDVLMAMLQMPMGHTLSPEEAKLLMNQTVQQIQDTLSIPDDVAQHLLMHCRWNVDFLIQCYVENRETLLISSGLQVQDAQPALSPGTHCPVCVNQLCPTEKPPTLCCMHYCCKSCWREYLTTRIEQNMVVNCTCPISECRAQPTTAFIYSIISSKEIIAKYEKALLRVYVECCSNLTWCTNPQGCDQILLKDGLGYGAACSKCSWISCFNCNFPEAHYPASCSHMSQWVDDDGYYEGMTTEAQSKHLAKLISKHCPSCQAQIEKNEGCLHMTCAKCNHGFCWRCLKPWRPTHKDYYNCSAMVSKAAWQEKRFQDYNERCTFHHRAREFATSLRNRVSSISEMPKIRSLTFVLHACKVLEQARKVLAYSCVYSYYNQDHESMDVVEQQTESLELHTNALQILLEEALLQYQDLACSLQLLKAEHFSTGLELVHQIKERLFAILWHSTQDFHVGLQTSADPGQRKVELSNVPASAPAFIGPKSTVFCNSPNTDEGGKEVEDEEYEPQWQVDYDDDDDLDEDNFLFDDESDNLDCDSYFDDDDAYD